MAAPLPLTTPEGEPLYSLVRVDALRVELDHSAAKLDSLTRVLGSALHLDKSYVKMYMDPEHHPAPSFHGTLAQGRAEWWFLPRRAHPDTPVLVDLYLVRDNHERSPCAFVAATGLVPYSTFASAPEGTVLQVKVFDGPRPALGRLSFRLATATPLSADPSLARAPVPRPPAWRTPRLPRELSDPALASLLVPTTPTVFHEHTPKWALVHAEESPHEPTPAAYWDHAVSVACAMIGIEVERFVEAPHAFAEVLGQVVGLVAWQTPYLRWVAIGDCNCRN
jgi:hypothetical protein